MRPRPVSAAALRLLVFWGYLFAQAFARTPRNSQGFNTTYDQSSIAPVPCPESIFAEVPRDAGGFTLMLTTIVASLPIMGSGL